MIVKQPEIIQDLQDKITGLYDNDPNIQKVELSIYYGASGAGRGSTCIRITVPYDSKSCEEF